MALALRKVSPTLFHQCFQLLWELFDEFGQVNFRKDSPDFSVRFFFSDTIGSRWNCNENPPDRRVFFFSPFPTPTATRRTLASFVVVVYRRAAAEGWGRRPWFDAFVCRCSYREIAVEIGPTTRRASSHIVANASAAGPRDPPPGPLR